MRKAEKISLYLGELNLAEGADPVQYRGYFECFNRQLFYEAHDVLEDLWLKEGRSGANYAFYKGLIQLAGAFVHLQKGRLRPAIALFNLAEANLIKYPDLHDGLDLGMVLKLIEDWRKAVRPDDPEGNPLGKRSPPRLMLPG